MVLKNIAARMASVLLITRKTMTTTAKYERSIHAETEMVRCEVIHMLVFMHDVALLPGTFCTGKATD